MIEQLDNHHQQSHRKEVKEVINFLLFDLHRSYFCRHRLIQSGDF